MSSSLVSMLCVGCSACGGASVAVVTPVGSSPKSCTRYWWVPAKLSWIAACAFGGSWCMISRTRAWRRPTALRSGIPGVA
ncbi:Uncharacterised protein [Mycobacteroides abscessus subsp. abscessus]|nr:Uncharacterised protein [Mycobacteroides abscessus subsp. abscessus]